MKKVSNRRRSPRHPVPAEKKTGRPTKTWVNGLLGLLLIACIAFGIWKGRAPGRFDRDVLPSPLPSAASPEVPADEIEPAPAVEGLTMVQIQAEELKLGKHVVATFSNDPKALALLASIHRHHGDPGRNMELLQRALATDPNEAELYVRLGQGANDRGEQEKALAYWQEGLRRSPQTPNLRWHMAETYIDQGKHELAVELLRQECTLVPRSVRSHYLLGQAYSQLKDYENAKASYEKAIEISPTHYNAFYGLGNACARLRERDEAKAYMAKFRVLKERHEAARDQEYKADEVPGARRRMARFYLRAYHIYEGQGHMREAVSLLERAAVLDPNNATCLEKLGAHHLLSGRLPHALRLFEKARSVDPNNPLHHVNVAKLHTRMNQFDLAEQSYSAVIERFPKYALGYAEFARLYLRSRQKPSEALRLAKNAVKFDGSAANYHLLSWACDINGQLNASLGAIEKAIELAPENKSYRVLHERIGQKLPRP